jgi:S-adenosylmethionine synthetase
VKPSFTAESVSEGHPDKVCDYIADRILDECLQSNPLSKVACEVMCKNDCVVLGGEVETDVRVDYDAIVRSALFDIGYDYPGGIFRYDRIKVVNLISRVSHRLLDSGREAAGDQGMVFGYATTQTPSLMPLPITLAHRVTSAIAHCRKQGICPWLRPDAKAQVTMKTGKGREEHPELDSVVVSAQHSPEVDLGQLRGFIRDHVLTRALGAFLRDETVVLINPLGHFDVGGPEADCGVTGRKLMVDTYGSWARHGGGAFSGKDPSKVDRSGAYFARYVARQIVKRGLASEVEIQVSYAPGRKEPVAVSADSRGTGDEALILDFLKQYDFSLPSIIDFLRLRRACYSNTTNYGHFGKRGLSWEQ